MCALGSEAGVCIKIDSQCHMTPAYQQQAQVTAVMHTEPTQLMNLCK